jgi:hypothetical protein
VSYTKKIKTTLSGTSAAGVAGHSATNCRAPAASLTLSASSGGQMKPFASHADIKLQAITIKLHFVDPNLPLRPVQPQAYKAAER